MILEGARASCLMGKLIILFNLEALRRYTTPRAKL